MNRLTCFDSECTIFCGWKCKDKFESFEIRNTADISDYILTVFARANWVQFLGVVCNLLRSLSSPAPHSLTSLCRMWGRLVSKKVCRSLVGFERSYSKAGDVRSCANL